MKLKIKQKYQKRLGAFTLIEMLIVLVIVGLLMAIIIPNVAGQRDRIEAQATKNIAEIVETQVNTYKLVESEEPSLATLVEKGYLTQKQSDEAVKLLQLDNATTITIPIDIPE